MDQNDKPPVNDCQLQVLTEGTQPIGVRDKMRTMALRLLTAGERRINRLRRALGQPPEILTKAVPAVRTDTAPDSSTTAGQAGGPFKPGDLVEVLSLSEIRATLDDIGNYDGLRFMEGMEAYCGRRYVVRKRVRNMFDERAWRMVRIRNAYVLDSVICEGRGLYDKEGCDRCCFYFWKDRWLRKVETP